MNFLLFLGKRSERLVRILEHKYESDLSFDKLKGNDLAIAELLTKSNKLQVYLAEINIIQEGILLTNNLKI